MTPTQFKRDMALIRSLQYAVNAHNRRKPKAAWYWLLVWAANGGAL